MAPESWFSIYFLLFFDVGSTFFTYRIFIYGILYLYTKKSGNICFQISPRGANQIWTGDRGVADLCLTTWLWRRIECLFRITKISGFVNPKMKKYFENLNHGIFQSKCNTPLHLLWKMLLLHLLWRILSLAFYFPLVSNSFWFINYFRKARFLLCKRKLLNTWP